MTMADALPVALAALAMLIAVLIFRRNKNVWICIVLYWMLVAFKYATELARM